MAHQPAFVRVLDAVAPVQLLDLAHVVQGRAGQQEAPVQERVMAAPGHAQLHHGERVVHEPADVRVVKGLGGGELLEPLLHQGVGEDVLQQLAEVGFVHLGLDQADQPGQVLVGILGRAPDEVLHVDGGGIHPLDLVHGDLQAAVVVLGHAQHVDEIIHLEPLAEGVDVVPHEGRQAAGLVGQDREEILSAGFLRADLLLADQEQVVHGLVGLVVGDVVAFHANGSFLWLSRSTASSRACTLDTLLRSGPR